MGEPDHAACRCRAGGAAVRNLSEDRAVRDTLRSRRVLPAEGSTGEALEPRLELRVMRGGIDLKVQVRTGRVAGLADEPDRLPCAEHRTGGDLRIEIGEMAIR